MTCVCFRSPGGRFAVRWDWTSRNASIHQDHRVRLPLRSSSSTTRHRLTTHYNADSMPYEPGYGGSCTWTRRVARPDPIQSYQFHNATLLPLRARPSGWMQPVQASGTARPWLVLYIDIYRYNDFGDTSDNNNEGYTSTFLPTGTAIGVETVCPDERHGPTLADTDTCDTCDVRRTTGSAIGVPTAPSAMEAAVGTPADPHGHHTSPITTPSSCSNPWRLTSRPYDPSHVPPRLARPSHAPPRLAPPSHHRMPHLA
jgi:hypothetical protein